MNLYRTELGEKCALALGERARATIGRAATCDLVIADQFVSRVHASIQRVDDQHVLQDAGSSNGTLLNGLRLIPAHAFPLREGDLIEIGTARFLYGSGIKPDLPAKAEDDAAHADRTYPVVGLLRDGWQRFGGEKGAAIQAGIERSLAEAPGAIGLERCLALVAAELAVDIASFYVGRAARLELLGSHPRSPAEPGFGPLALRAWNDREACHSEGAFLGGAGSLNETSVLPMKSALAIPFFRRKLGCVLAVERTCGRGFDRTDLVHAAVVAERVARVACIGSVSGNDTPFG